MQQSVKIFPRRYGRIGFFFLLAQIPVYTGTYCVDQRGNIHFIALKCNDLLHQKVQGDIGCGPCSGKNHF